MAEIPQSTIEDVFDDFDGRRSGIFKALTTDFIEFYEQEQGAVFVGLPNGTWEVKPPARMVSPDHPRPVSGLHFGRNRMPGQVWAASIAACWDLWLLAFALYFDGRGLPKRDSTSTCTEELFQRINELATVCETVKEFGASNDQSAAMMLKKPGQSKSSGTHVNSSVDESRAQKDGIGAAIEDGHNDGSSSFAQSKSSGAYVNSSDDDSRTQTDEYNAAIGDDHDEGSRNYEQRKSSGNHVSSSDDDSGDSWCFRMC